ncbi:unnamed protein product [Polarella glacialis]|uniref:tRNA-uridine aminocarboxypropyltransferase 1 n=1 Tax=Polarella glacialis TaxID=89957 RepID=A0A813L7K1_POLGL|nr:unnamed protein product [Polarella glacialis]
MAALPADGAEAEPEPSLDVPAALAAELTGWRREACPSCGASAMFYCPYCCAPLGVPEGITVPRARLPFARCDIIFDDAPKKATSIHAKVLAPDQVRLIDLFTQDANSNRTLSRPSGGPQAELGSQASGLQGGDDKEAAAVIREIPEYDFSRAMVLFPDDSSITFEEARASGSLCLAEDFILVVIDAPWRRAQVLRKHPRLAPLRSVRLSSPPPSRFWRYHSEGVGCVSTVEALAALVREFPAAPSQPSWADADVRGAGQVDEAATLDPLLDDPLLFFFVRQFAYISERQRSAGIEERPMDPAAKQRRTEKVRQRERVKSLRPYERQDDGDPGSRVAVRSACSPSSEAK